MKEVFKSQNKPAQAKTSRALLARGASVSSEHATHTIKNKMQASARAGWRAQMSVFERCRMGGKGCASVCIPLELVGARRSLACRQRLVAALLSQNAGMQVSWPRNLQLHGLDEKSWYRPTNSIYAAPWYGILNRFRKFYNSPNSESELLTHTHTLSRDPRTN